MAGKRKLEEPLAGKSTLNRLELTPAGSPLHDRYHKITYSTEAVDELLVDIFLEAHAKAPRQIVLDLDVTDTPLYGQQEERFFHGYYNEYCYLPLYIFCGDHLLCARQRASNQDASAGSREEVERIVQQIRRRWPKVRIILRTDSGFCREELMAWCEQNQVDYVFGLARNARLQRKIAPQLRQAKQEQERTGQAARVYTEFSYRTRNSWSRSRRVVAKAEYLEKGENPRFVVTSLSAESWEAAPLYEKSYCGRGEMENRITEQLSLFADRMSTESLRANQLRLYFSSLAYVLVHALRRLALADTEWAQAQVHTIRLRLLKIVAEVRLSVRRIWVSFSNAYKTNPSFVSLVGDCFHCCPASASIAVRQLASDGYKLCRGPTIAFNVSNSSRKRHWPKHELASAPSLCNQSCSGAGSMDEQEGRTADTTGISDSSSSLVDIKPAGFCLSSAQLRKPSGRAFL
jgi:Transposase DDE domain group 1